MNQQEAFVTSSPRGSASRLILIRLGLLGCLSAVVLVSSGCRPAIERKLVGSWQLDESEGLAKRMMGGNSSSVGSELMDTALDEMMEVAQVALSVEFARSGKLTTSTNVMGEPTQKTGTWSMTEHTENTATIEFVLEGDEPETIKVRFVDDDTIEMVPPNLAVLNREYTFKRTK